MSATAEVVPAKKQVAKITSKGQITIPLEIRRLLGAKPGDKLVFEPTATGIRIVRQNPEVIVEKFRSATKDIPELNGSIDDVVRYMREFRGHDEYDDLVYGTER